MKTVEKMIFNGALIAIGADTITTAAGLILGYKESNVLKEWSIMTSVLLILAMIYIEKKLHKRDDWRTAYIIICLMIFAARGLAVVNNLSIIAQHL